MQILKRYSHKGAGDILVNEKPTLIAEIEASILKINAVDCLRKVSKEKSKRSKSGGLLFSPPAMNILFRKLLLEPYQWVEWDSAKNRYVQPTLRFPSTDTLRGSDRFRKMDGLKARVGLEVQMGKYAFMGYDIFSKMIIFKNAGLIDYGIEIVLVQTMIEHMSTGVSAFEHLMIDFVHRGTADIDIPVLVVGIGPTAEEWEAVHTIQNLYATDRERALALYPEIGQSDLRGTPPGPK